MKGNLFTICVTILNFSVLIGIIYAISKIFKSLINTSKTNNNIEKKLDAILKNLDDKNDKK